MRNVHNELGDTCCFLIEIACNVTARYSVSERGLLEISCGSKTEHVEF